PVRKVMALLGQNVYPAVTEVTDQQRAGRVTPAGRRDRQAPRGIERAAGGDTGDQVAVGAELVHHAQAVADRLPVRDWIGLVVGHEDFAVQGLGVEGQVPAGQPRVPELPARRLDLVERGVEDIDPALREVGREEPVAVAGGGYREPGVPGPGNGCL